MKVIDYGLEPGQINRVLFDHSDGAVAALKIGSVRFEPGQRLPAEGAGSHAEDELSFIISGSLTGESGGEHFSIGGGDLTLIPAGEEHWAVAGPGNSGPTGQPHGGRAGTPSGMQGYCIVIDRQPRQKYAGRNHSSGKRPRAAVTTASTAFQHG